jgi:large subunit ribosomal protein L25
MDLNVKTREILGRSVKSLRNEGLVPAELYGRGVSNRHLSVSAKDFLKVYKEAGESVVVTLDLGGEKVPVLIHEVSFDPVKNFPLHVDFYQVNMKEKTTTSVPLEFIGVSPAVKEKKGVLIKAMQEIEVEALPADLPSKIEADISVINEIGESIHVKDLKAIAGVEFLVDGESVVATVSEQAKEEEIPTGPASVEEVKVEGEEKKSEEKGKEEEGENKGQK